MSYGTVNCDVLSASNGESIGVGSGQGLINRIINGSMTIDQRNAGASVVVPNNGTAYPVDRFFVGKDSNSGVVNTQQSSSAPTGFSNSILVSIGTSFTPASGEGFLVNQRIEGYNTSDLGWGTANAKTVTLSFWVQSSLTGTFSGSFVNSAFNYSYPFTYSIPVANTWTQISVTVAGPTAGTWIGSTNGIGMRVYWNLGSGSSLLGTAGAWAASGLLGATGSVSIAGTNGATFYLTGVQLQKGSSATGFEYRQIQQELALCQRYYQKYLGAIQGSWGNTTVTYQTYLYPVIMRTAPTWSYSNIGYASSSTLSTNSSTTALLRTALTITAGGGYGYATFDMETSGTEL